VPCSRTSRVWDNSLAIELRIVPFNVAIPIFFSQMQGETVWPDTPTALVFIPLLAEHDPSRERPQQPIP